MVYNLEIHGKCMGGVKKVFTKILFDKFVLNFLNVDVAHMNNVKKSVNFFALNKM